MLSGLSLLLVYLGGERGRLIMWQRSHGRRPLFDEEEGLFD